MRESRMHSSLALKEFHGQINPFVFNSTFTKNRIKDFVVKSTLLFLILHLQKIG